ncbi:MAG: hypothetical protein ACRYG8_10300 [Janthinobacterium lividum]
MEQDSIICSAYLFDIGRHELGIVDTTGHFGLSQHALKRLYQRSNFIAGDLDRLLDILTSFAAPLIRARLTPENREFDVAIPFMDGLLRGAVEPNFHEEGQEPQFRLISKGGEEPPLALAFPFVVDKGRHCTASLRIHAYIGAKDLFPDQQEIVAALKDMTAKHLEAMRHMRDALFRGYPDLRMAERYQSIRPGVSLENLADMHGAMMRFFETDDWQEQAASHRRPRVTLQ